MKILDRLLRFSWFEVVFSNKMNDNVFNIKDFGLLIVIFATSCKS